MKANVICGIYAIRNTVDGKVYIGQSSDIISRKNKHYRLLRNGSHHNDHLQLSYNKYGEKVFEFSVIESVELSLLNTRERYWIEQYNSNNNEFGYNRDDGGCECRIRSEETRQKLRIANIGKVRSRESVEKSAKAIRGIKRESPSEETRRKISLSLTGRKGTPCSEENRVLLKLMFTGRYVSEETRLKQSMKRKGRRFASDETLQKMQIKNQERVSRMRSMTLLEELPAGIANNCECNMVPVVNRLFVLDKWKCRVVCDKCKLSTGLFADKRYAVNAWNRGRTETKEAS